MRVLLTFMLSLATLTAHGQLLWSEEFNYQGAPDASLWSYDLGANGWGNQELQLYTDNLDNVVVEEGALRIKVRAPAASSGSRFTSGRIRTQDKVTFLYATVEARIKVPDLANGLWPAFWTLGNNFSAVGWPACGEIDIMEMGNSAAIAQQVVNRRVGSTAHWENNGGHVYYGLSRDAEQDLSGRWVVLRMEWTPESITTYIDGERIWIMDTQPPSCRDCEEFHEPHFFILNVAVGGTYPGRFSNAAISAPMPAQLEVDWIRVYDNGHTVMGGSGVERTPAPISTAHAGSWFNAEQSGHGFSMEIGRSGEDPAAVVYWYTFDRDGNPIFLVGSGTPDGNILDLDFSAATGMSFGTFDPATVDREHAGTARIVFADKDNALFDYRPSEFSRQTWGHVDVLELPIEKLFDIQD